MLFFNNSLIKMLISKLGEHNKCSFLPAKKQTDKMLISKLGEHNKCSFLPAKKQTDIILTNMIPLGGE